jgi:MFS family permease
VTLPRSGGAGLRRWRLIGKMPAGEPPLTDTLRSTLPRLQATRFVRALGQGVLSVVFSLALIDIGWSPAAAGLLFTVGGLGNALASWLVGMASDRQGRRSFLLAFEALSLAAGLLLAVRVDALFLGIASLVAGFGRNQGGVPGLVSPAEQAWLARSAPAAGRGMLFSVNAALGFLGMGVGSLAAGLVPAAGHFLSGMDVYRPFFFFAALTSAADLALLVGAAEGQPEAQPAPTAAAASGAAVGGNHGGGDDGAVHRQENGVMIRMALINALNGVAIGLTSPLLVYWFKLRFDATPEALGYVFAATFVATAAASVWTGTLSRKVGIVKAVVSVRLVAVALFVVLPLMPTLWLASIVHAARTAFGRGSAGARQALAVNLVRDSRRGVASSINQVSMNLPNAAGPGIAGLFLEAGNLTMPFFLAAGMQFLYGTLYGAAFARYERAPREAARG